MDSNSEPHQRPPSQNQQPIEEDFLEDEDQGVLPPQQPSLPPPQITTLMLGGGAPNTQSQDLNSSSVSPGPHQGAEELEKNLDDASNLLETETGLFHQRMWGCFQNCARAVAQVYMSNKQQPMPEQQPSSSNHHAKPVEESFKSAAQHATNLYKDSLETSRRLIDLGIKTGSNRRTKEILSFIKSRKKRFIKRDELISYLIGKSSIGSGGSRKSHGVLEWGHSTPQWSGGVHGAFSMITFSPPQGHSSLPQHCPTDPQHHNHNNTTNQRTSSAQPLANSSTDDPAMLHLAVEQLFVEQYVQAAGVKRTAKDEDEAMEDEGDGAFKRMRFY